MFGKIHDKLNAILTSQSTHSSSLEAVSDVIDLETASIERRLSDIQTWVELIALEDADGIAAKFEKRLDEAVAAKEKLTNKKLVEMVRESAADARK